jgi:hypothetical protein
MTLGGPHMNLSHASALAVAVPLFASLLTASPARLPAPAPSSAQKKELPECKPQKNQSLWPWKVEKLGKASVEIPKPFVEHLSTDARERLWEYGPRTIRLTLTTDPHAERDQTHFSGRCELLLGDRSVEVVTTSPRGSERSIIARVPNVDGGFDLLVEVSTRYPSELEALRRVISSVTVADSAKS